MGIQVWGNINFPKGDRNVSIKIGLDTSMKLLKQEFVKNIIYGSLGTRNDVLGPRETVYLGWPYIPTKESNNLMSNINLM